MLKVNDNMYYEKKGMTYNDSLQEWGEGQVVFHRVFSSHLHRWIEGDCPEVWQFNCNIDRKGSLAVYLSSHSFAI